MNSSRRGYLMALAVGAAIIGGATAGVSELASAPTVSAQAPPASAAPANTVPANTVPADPSPTSAAVPSGPAGSDIPSAATPSETFPRVTTGPIGKPPPTGLSTAGRSSTSAPAKTAEPSRPTAAPPSVAPSGPPPPAAPSSAAPPAASKYKDGQYTAKGDYASPGGVQNLGVTVTLKGDAVTEAKLELLGDVGIAHSYQALFESGYSAQVIGKNIDSIQLGAVAGSSLTGMGFNKALTQIEEQARG